MFAERDRSVQRSVALGRVVTVLRVGTIAWILIAFSVLFVLHFTNHTDLDALIATIAVFVGTSALGFAYIVFSRKLLLALERRYQGRLHVRNLELQSIAMRDDLTRLFNRRYFYDRFQRELNEAHVLGHALGVVLLDVDGLKDVNDTFGHKVGDEVLAAVGRILTEHARGCDVPARVGGDEFAVLMLAADKRGVSNAAKRLYAALDGAPVDETDGASLKLRVSHGFSGYPWGGDSVDEIVRAADAQLYAAKAARRQPSEPSRSSEPAGVLPSEG